MSDHDPSAPGEGRSIQVSISRDQAIADMGGKRSFADARAAGACVICGRTPLGPFTDALSEKEAGISQTCQGCQDRIFQEDEDEDGDALRARLMPPAAPQPPRCSKATCEHFVEGASLPGASLSHCGLLQIRLQYTSAPVPSWCPRDHQGAAGEALRAALLRCAECGWAYEPPRDRLQALDWASPQQHCRLCAHFLHDRGARDVVIVEANGHRMFYTIGPEPSARTPRWGLGHGGSAFRFRRTDGTEFVSHNVWSAGAIPPWLWPKLPINATLLPDQP
jgi:hypothetical protein